MNMPYTWLIVIVVMTLIEIITTQLVSIWFVAGGIAAFITSLVTNSIFTQVLVFITVTFICLILTRPLVKKLFAFKKEETNITSFIGKHGVVIQKINNEEYTGQVNVNGSIWTARSDDGSVINAGEKIVVKKIEGVKLIVNILKK